MCTDGSDLADHAIRTGLEVLAPADRTVVATVMEDVDPSMMTGVSGFGTPPPVSPKDIVEVHNVRREAAEALLRRTAATVGEAAGAGEVETRVLEGDPPRALVALAAELGATTLVIGTRGRGGLKRAVLGSVSDHVVRHAPCAVLIVTDDERSTGSG